MNTSTRRPVTALIAVVLSVIVVALATAATLPASRKATVAFSRGEVRIDGIKADIGQELGATAFVETGPGARCDIIFGGGNALSVSQNAKVRFDFSSPAIGVKLDKGGVTSVVKKLEKLTDRAAYNVSTQLTVAGVRGTSFCVWCDADSTYVCACNGEVHTEDVAGGNGFDLAAAHHVARVYERKDGRVTVSEAGLLHHDDAIVESVARTIGYSIDWTKIDR